MFGRRHVKSRQDLVRAEFGESVDLLRQAAAHAAGGLGATVGPHLGSAKSTAKDKTASARGFVKPAAGRVTNAASAGWDSTLAAFAPLAEAAKQGSERGAKLRAKDLSHKENKSRKNNKGSKGSKGSKDSHSIVAFASTKSQPEPAGHGTLYLLLATGAAVGAAGALAARRRTRTKWAEYEPASLQSDATSFADAGATSKSFSGKSDKTDKPDKLSKSELSGKDIDASGTVSKATTWTKEHAKSTVDTLRHKIHEATAERDDDSAVTEKAGKVNEGASHLADKAEARLNASSHSGGSTTNTSGADKRPGDRIDDEVDDLLRSAKNGRI